jgi:hypothetical protein
MQQLPDRLQRLRDISNDERKRRKLRSTEGGLKTTQVKNCIYRKLIQLMFLAVSDVATGAVLKPAQVPIQ